MSRGAPPTPGPAAPPRPRGDLALLVSARLGTVLGSTATTVAVVLLAEPRGAWAVSLLLGAELVAVLLAAPLAGVLVDRCPARRLVVTACLVQATAVAAGSLATGSLPVLLVALAVVGAGQAVVGPAVQALVPWVVGEERSARGYAATAVAGNVGFLVGLPVGGLAVGLLGAGVALRLDAATFVVEAALVALLRARRVPREQVAPRSRTSRDEVLAGVRWLAGDRVLAVCTVGLAVALVCVTSVNVAEVFVVVRLLGASETVYGLVSAAWAVSSLAASWAAGRLRSPAATARALLGSCVLLGAGLLLAGVGGATLQLWGVVLGWVVAGAGNGVAVVASSALVRQRTPDARRGRVFAALQVLYQAANVSSLLLGAGLVGLVGAAETLLLAGAVSAVVGVVFLVLLGRVVAAHPAGDDAAGDDAAIGTPQPRQTALDGTADTASPRSGSTPTGAGP